MARRSYWSVGLLLAVAAIGAGGFFGGRAILGLANPPPEPSVQMESPLDPGPPFEGVVNGIEIVPVAKEGPSDGYCTGDRASNAPYAVTVGTVWEIEPAYLPAGAIEDHPGYVPDPREDDFVPVTLCDGEIARSFRQYRYHGTDSAWIELSIAKLRTRSMVIDTDATRIQSRTIAGKPAVVIAPAPRDDLLETYLIIAEEFGQTRVYGLGLPLDELVKVAAALK
ncbi:MAG TPA: hypothetical protein VNM43_10865 [Dehalococcoidia bacterium]|nr:hypothetical protein [Dehalococcoidia bacterium]